MSALKIRLLVLEEVVCRFFNYDELEKTEEVDLQWKKYLTHKQVVKPVESISHASNSPHRARQTAVKGSRPTENPDVKITFLTDINGSKSLKPVKLSGSKYINYSGVVKNPMGGESMVTG